MEGTTKGSTISRFDIIENFLLIENGLLHMEFETSRSSPSYFRLAREAHLVLYRSMVEALKGTANLEVTGKKRGNRSTKYQFGKEPWHEIHKEEVTGCKKAWRFSKPVKCEAPKLEEYSRSPDFDPVRDNYLVSFYDTLAMIQTRCHMHKYYKISREVSIPDNQMRVLVWLHERVRNEYEHFMPKTYAASEEELLEVTFLCLRLSQRLLFECGNVYFDNDPLEKRVRELIKALILFCSN